MPESILKKKSYEFAIRTVNFELSLLKDTNNIEMTEFESISSDCKELIRMLVATVKTTASPMKPSWNSNF